MRQTCPIPQTNSCDRNSEPTRDAVLSLHSNHWLTADVISSLYSSQEGADPLIQTWSTNIAYSPKVLGNGLRSRSTVLTSLLSGRRLSLRRGLLAPPGLLSRRVTCAGSVWMVSYTDCTPLDRTVEEHVTSHSHDAINSFSHVCSGPCK